MRWRTVIICEGRRLEEVLLALAGRVVSVETPVPIVEAGDGGKVSRDDLPGLLAAEMAGKTGVRKPEIVAWLEARGLSRRGYETLLRKLKKQGLVKVAGAKTKPHYSFPKR